MANLTKRTSPDYAHSLYEGDNHEWEHDKRMQQVLRKYKLTDMHASLDSSDFMVGHGVVTNRADLNK